MPYEHHTTINEEMENCNLPDSESKNQREEKNDYDLSAGISQSPPRRRQIQTSLKANQKGPELLDYNTCAAKTKSLSTSAASPLFVLSTLSSASKKVN